MRHTTKWLGRALGVALAAGTVGACDFIESTSVDPNAVPLETATIDQLFTGVQVNTFYFNESQISRLAAMWTQQMAGTARQFTALDQYVFTEEEADGEFATLYTGGGLVDIRRATALAEEAGCSTCAGILKIHEAYFMGMGAGVFGDLPYSGAVDIEANPEPALDEQADVYAAVQTLLDEAIADLAAGPGDSEAAQGAYGAISGADMNFGGDDAAWTQVAYTLKARYYLHWVEAATDKPAQYQLALAAAEQGINTIENNWRSIHSSAATENNLWYQFMRDRSGYVSSGEYLVELLNAGTPTLFTDDDPRIELYFNTVEIDTNDDDEPDSDAYVGRSSDLSDVGAGAPDYDQPIASCAEAQFIIAEAQAALGDEPAARAAVNDALDCQEAWWAPYGARAGVDVDLTPVRLALAAVPDASLLEFIIDQKYAALFLNMEVWNDYKRTCLPAVTPTVDGAEIPGRLYYGQSERQTNPNIPTPAQQDLAPRNDNDPNAC